MRNLLNKYFGFTKREFNGLMVLFAILIIVTVIPYFYTLYFTEQQSMLANEKVALQKLILVNQQNPNFHYQVRNQVEDNEVTTTLFNFDPNKIDVIEWKKLGLSLKQAQSIVNYRNKGGKFYKAEDLHKMYTITPEKFKQLLPYITIGDVMSQYPNKTYPDKVPNVKKELEIIEVNGADTLKLDEIKGIGAAFARRISQYRDKLGGFYKKEQLLEVYGLDSTKFAEIKNQIKIDANAIKKMNINTAQFDDLKNHPYLKYKQMNAIIQYRKQHGNFKDIDDLRKVAILSPQTIQNLEPYLIF